MHQNLSFWGQKVIFYWGGPLHYIPLPLTPTAPRRLLTEILNTPLDMARHSAADCGNKIRASVRLASLAKLTENPRSLRQPFLRVDLLT